MLMILIQRAEHDDDKPGVLDVKIETRTGLDVEVLVQPPSILERFAIESIRQPASCDLAQVSRLKPELAPLSMPVRPAGYRHGPAGRPSGGNAASELRLLRRSGALSR